MLVTANCRWRNHVGFVHLRKSQRTHYTRVQAARRLRARISAYGNNPFIKMQLRMHVTQKMSLLSPARARSPAAPPPLIRRVARFENSLKKILINSLLFAALSHFSSFFTRPRAPHSNPHNIALVFSSLSSSKRRREFVFSLSEVSVDQKRNKIKSRRLLMDNSSTMLLRCHCWP